MKTLKTIFAALVLVSFATVTVSAQTSDTASEVEASATIISPIAISNSQGLNFGVIVPGTEVGYVVVSADGENRDATGGASTLENQDDTFSNAIFSVTGASGYTFSITLPDDIVLSNGSEDMTVDTFTLDGAAATDNTIGGSAFPFGVGARLVVASGQGAGTYEGSFDVTVQYE